MAANSSVSNFSEVRKLIATPELPELGPGPRAGVLSRPPSELASDAPHARARLPITAHQHIRAAVLLWHDHLDAAHQFAQNLPDSGGSVLHGIMHRREPDYGNAKYWFQRAGPHPAFPVLSRRVAELLQTKKEA